MGGYLSCNNPSEGADEFQNLGKSIGMADSQTSVAEQVWTGVHNTLQQEEIPGNEL